MTTENIINMIISIELNTLNQLIETLENKENRDEDDEYTLNCYKKQRAALYENIVEGVTK